MSRGRLFAAKIMTSRQLVWLLVAAIAGLGTPIALATPVGQMPSPVIEINGSALDLGALNCASRGSQVVCGGTSLQGNGYVLNSWAFALDPDPSITGTFNLTNLSAITQTFILTVTLPIAQVGSPVSIAGYIGAGTLTDANGGGATLTDDGSSIYAALINGVPVHTLLDPPQSFSVLANSFGGPGTPLTINQVSFGPSVIAQGANGSIGTRVQFTLTSGDNVQWPIGFAVTGVPEPSMLMLLGGGLACLVAFGRRRSA